MVQCIQYDRNPRSSSDFQLRLMDITEVDNWNTSASSKQHNTDVKDTGIFKLFLLSLFGKMPVKFYFHWF